MLNLMLFPDGGIAARPALAMRRVVTLDRPPTADELEELVGRSAAGEVEVRVRIPTPDRRLAAVLEPGAAPPLRRFAALRVLRRAGLEPGLLLAPLVPGIHDHERDLVELLGRARAAHGAHVAFRIDVPSEVRAVELHRELALRYPRVAARFEVHRRTSGLSPPEEVDRIADLLARLARRFGVPLRDSGGRPEARLPLQRRFPFGTRS
jgi:DNA repair photolyase